MPGGRAVTARVILADDHRMLREGLRRSLEEHGLEVLAEASDGAEAVRLAQELSPDVVLMDLSMPVLDGIAATRLVRQRAPETQVVILTMHSDDESVARAIRAGAAGYLVKDCSTAEVVDTIEKVASGEVVLSPELAASMLEESAGQPVISEREEEVLQLIADGLSPTEVAGRLYISVKTVKNHLTSIYQKLDSRDRTQAVVRAVRMGIIRLD
jgi:two-component system, NarL family, response regulator DegU